jgi:GNAT superfamily N-acetyltransferase
MYSSERGTRGRDSHRQEVMDMLIRLYGQLQDPPILSGWECRKPLGSECTLVAQWVEAHFSPAWSSEASAALANRPITLFIAQQGNDLQGFCCYDATARGFVGPIGVVESARGTGIGAALLLACLYDMRTMGYGYAIAGHVGAPDFFRKVAGATEIPDSTPGLYANMLR